MKIKNILLRPFKNGDEHSLRRNINDKTVYRYTSSIPYPYTMNDARKWLNEARSANKKKSAVHLAITTRQQVIGGIGLLKIKRHGAEIGYWLGRGHRGKGIMTSAVKALTAYGFSKLKLKRILTLSYSVVIAILVVITSYLLKLKIDYNIKEKNI
ncbi:GNAT family N-acetyltransferase [candidate division KSB1 bacterium]|nr:GNAT family N-acetyltransferase [candidate division KSB1 bacterium]